ncbi:hypothetical protein [Candidatus Xenohaliotis californiensis]|uniref:tetratricopeptide repeat protein n=1 Tax=Candidatus Xenohaliotis californiensis TaxID=84677 RepID=UPI0030C8B74A
MIDKKNNNTPTVKNIAYDAQQAIRLKHLEVGIKILKDGMQTLGNNQYLMQNLALAYYMNKMYKKSSAIYAELLQKNPKDESMLNNYMISLSANSQGDAINTINNLWNLYPRSHIIPAQLGILYSQMNNIVQAIYSYTAAIKIEPRIDYKYNLAILLDKTGEKTAALMMYKDIISYFANGIASNKTYNIPIDAIRNRINSLNKNAS